MMPPSSVTSTAATIACTGASPIRSLATKVLHINDGVVTPYSGGYDYYLEKTGAEENARAAVIAG